MQHVIEISLFQECNHPFAFFLFKITAYTLKTIIFTKIIDIDSYVLY